MIELDAIAAPKPRRPRTRKAVRQAEAAIGTKLLMSDHLRLLGHLRLTGERKAAFVRRALVALLAQEAATCGSEP